MARGSFGRTVARAASSGGSRSYRARPPTLWYLLMTIIVVGGIGLVAYSRYEVLHPAGAAAEGPTQSDNWQAALAIDICGKIEPYLPQNTNLSSTGIRTFGGGLIDAAPAVSSTPSQYEGAKATLGLFAKKYTGFTLTPTSIGYPGKHEKIYKNGDSCTGKLKGKGTLEASVWASPTATAGSIVTNPTTIHITNGEMITVAFVPAGASIPQPPSKAALVTAIGKSG